MATFGQITDNIAAYLSRDDAGLRSYIQEAIRRAVKMYEREPWWLNDAESSFITASGQATYSYTTAMVSPLSVVVNYNSNRYTLNPVSFQEFDAQNVTDYQGQPVDYAMFNGAFRLYPVPDGSYTVSYAYSTKFATLTASTDLSPLLTHAEDLIEQTALAWVLENHVQDYDRASRVKLNVIELKRNLVTESVMKTATGKIRPTRF